MKFTSSDHQHNTHTVQQTRNPNLDRISHHTKSKSHFADYQGST